MEAHRPEIDTDKLNDFLEADKAYQANHNQSSDPPARFCGADCRQSYREDRILGKALPTVSLDGQVVSHKKFCARLALCAACESKLEK